MTRCSENSDRCSSGAGRLIGRSLLVDIGEALRAVQIVVDSQEREHEERQNYHADRKAFEQTHGGGGYMLIFANRDDPAKIREVLFQARAGIADNIRAASEIGGYPTSLAALICAERIPHEIKFGRLHARKNIGIGTAHDDSVIVHERGACTAANLILAEGREHLVDVDGGGENANGVAGL